LSFNLCIILIDLSKAYVCSIPPVMLRLMLVDAKYLHQFTKGQSTSHILRSILQKQRFSREQDKNNIF